MVTDWFLAGLRIGERLAMFAVDTRQQARVLDDLSVAGVDVDRCLRRGQLVMALAQDAYLRDGRFDVDARVAEYREHTLRAVTDGYTGLRVVAEAGWALADPVIKRDWPRYEFRADLLAAQLPFTALCCYDPAGAGFDEGFPLMLAVHAAHDGSEAADRHPMFSLRALPGGAVEVTGEIDASVADTVVSIVTAGAGEACPVLHVSGLRFVDAAGAEALARGASALARAHGQARVTGASRMLREIWRLLGYDSLVPLVVIE